MSRAAQQRLFKYLSFRREEEGFTLVELIVVVVIIGILSSIAIPSFQNSADKAKQKEASLLISSYIKAAQAYYTEYSLAPIYSKDLGQYMTVTGCRNPIPEGCKTWAPIDHSTRPSPRWISPNGYFHIKMEPRGSMLYFRAIPSGGYSATGYGVSGCFNQQTGSTKVTNISTKGTNVPTINC